jgi:hypothetical protein
MFFQPIFFYKKDFTYGKLDQLQSTISLPIEQHVLRLSLIVKGAQLKYFYRLKLVYNKTYILMNKNAFFNTAFRL